jgi:steroid delta-isomerase-like uncharacterized protein
MLAAGCDEDKKTAEGPAGPGASATAAALTPSAAATAAGAKAALSDTATTFGKKLSEAFAAHDAAKAAALFSADAVTQLMGDSDVGHDRAAVQKDFADTFGRYKDATIRIGRIWTSKTASVVEFAFAGTRSAGEMLGAKVTEKPVGLVGAMVLTFDDAGLAKTEHQYIDIATNVAQVDPKLLPEGVKVRPATQTLPAGSDVFESKGTPDEAKNVDVANKLFAALDTHKADDVVGPMTDDYVYEDFTRPGPMKKTETQQAAAAFFTALPDLKVTSKPVQFAAGSFVITEAVMDGTFKGAMSPFKPTNKPVTAHVLDVVELKDGKVTREWSYANNAEFLTQIGAMKLHAPTTTGAAPTGATGASH